MFLSRKASLFCISLAQFFELDTETLALILRAEAWRRNPKKVSRWFRRSVGFYDMLMMFHDILLIFHDILLIFHDILLIVHDILLIFHDILMIFNDIL